MWSLGTDLENIILQNQNQFYNMAITLKYYVNLSNEIY